LLQIRPDAVLLLAGEGELLEQMKAFAKELGIASKVRFLGARGDANRLYSAMDVFCLPSFYEGLPVVMIEALANGLTCVVSSCVTSELNSFCVHQLSLSESTEAWAAALSCTSRTQELPQALAKRFDIHHTVALLESFYLRQLNTKA